MRVRCSLRWVKEELRDGVQSLGQPAVDLVRQCLGVVSGNVVAKGNALADDEPVGAPSSADLTTAAGPSATG